MPADGVWDPWAAVLATVLVGYLVVVVPVLGRRRYAGLRAVRPAGALLRAYRRGMARQWLLAAAAVGLVLAAGVPVRELGLTGRQHDLRRMGPDLVSLVVLGLALTLYLRRRPATTRRMLRPAAALLPVTRRERRVFALVAVTAGITEELLYRGFLLLWLVHVQTVRPGLSVDAAAPVTAVLFGLAHAYQGWPGMLLTGLAGYGLAGVYVATGSLLLPVVLHALVDLRVLLVLRAPDEAAPGELSRAT